MFAFAIYDERRRELFIARDRLGKKPFFYAVLDGVLHFASELPALAASPSWKGELDLSGLEGYLSLGYFLAPSHAVYRRLQAAAGPLAARQGRPRRRRDATGTSREFDTDQRERERAGRRRRRDARHGGDERLESEVPLGAFLSGGIDSGCRVLHGRGARRSAGHDVGRIRRSRAQRARGGRADGGTCQGSRITRISIEPRSTR